LEGFSGTSSPREVSTAVRTLVLEIQKEGMGGKPTVVTVILPTTSFSTLIVTNKINTVMPPYWLTQYPWFSTAPKKFGKLKK
jgi:hypothetical protein